MLDIPEEIKKIYRLDNNSKEYSKKLKLRFYNDDVDVLYPYETLWPADDLYPEEHGEESLWLLIENDRIDTESLNITESLSSSEDMEFGSCESAMFEITVADVIEDVTGREFTATIEVGGYEMAFGIYTVESFVRQADRRKRKITAYDRMRKFDIDVAGWYNELVFPMTIKQFRDSLCEYIGVPQNQQTLLFDDMEISKTIEPEQISGRNVLQAICQINGCFGHIDKTGQLVYVMLQQTGLYPAEDLFPEETLYPSEYGGDGKPVEDVDYYKDLQYEDYLVGGITGLTIRQEEGDIGANVGTGENPYIIEGNFLVYGKSAVELLNIAQSLLPHISGRVYKPAKLQCYAMPWLEVGDAVRAQTRDDMVETFVMKRTMKGIQAMMDAIEATGAKQREEQFGINKKIIQLEGKTAVIITNVDEVSARVTNLKEETEAQFKITADRISAEVARATGVEESLSSRITVEAGRITSEVTRATTAEGTLSSRITQTEKDITLKVSVGDVTRQLNSELKITGNSIELTTGHFTVNAKNVSVDAKGNANFSGKVTGAEISGGTITGTNINGGDQIPFKATKGQVQIGDFYVDDEYGRHIFQSTDEVTGMSTGDISYGEWFLWAGYGYGSGSNNTVFAVNEGQVRIEGHLILNGRNIMDIINSSGGGGCSYDEDCDSSCDSCSDSCSSDGGVCPTYYPGCQGDGGCGPGDLGG